METKTRSTGSAWTMVMYNGVSSMKQPRIATLCCSLVSAYPLTWINVRVILQKVSATANEQVPNALTRHYYNGNRYTWGTLCTTMSYILICFSVT